VIGGDCTITLGVLAGFIRSRPNLGLLYPLMAGRDIVPFGYIPGEPAPVELPNFDGSWARQASCD
jgi:hypothetical protein